MKAANSMGEFDNESDELPPSEETLAYGQSILRLESQAVSLVADTLNDSFSGAVEKLLSVSSNGHVIVSGMGKAGFVGQKISATLASTGMPSFFLHPAEALHGDLGRYTKDDLALILSNSGETPEIISTLGPIKTVGCPIISITANAESTLGMYSDIVISIGKIKEAGPLGLAPTTSTTVMLALGDALAMSVLRLRGFSAEEFAFFHPGGNLGRALMIVSEVMRTGDKLPIATEDLSLREVLHRRVSTEGRPGATIIIGDNNKLVGIFTDGDLARCMDKHDDFLSLPISAVMTRNPKSIGPNNLAQEALKVMSDYKIDEVIVVNDSNEPIGLLDIQDLTSSALNSLSGRKI